MWVKAPAANADKTIYGEGNTGKSSPEFQNRHRFYRHSYCFRISVILTNTAGTNLITAGTNSTAVVFDNRWHHVVWTDNAGAGKLYIDGVQDAANFSYTPAPVPRNASSIGAVTGLFGAISHYFNGTIDDVRIYNRALSAGEVAYLYNSGATQIGASSATLQNGNELSERPRRPVDDGRQRHQLDVGHDARPQRSGQHRHTRSASTSRSAVGGHLGQALSFDGSTSYVGDQQSKAPLSPCRNHRHPSSAWIKPTGFFPQRSVQPTTRRPLSRMLM